MERNRDDGGTLEAGGDNSSAQSGVEDVCEGICELLCTVLQHTTRIAVRSCSLVSFDSEEGSPHAG